LPAEALLVERSCRIEIDGGEGDEIDPLFHRPILRSKGAA
jgi:hypothetical protein